MPLVQQPGSYLRVFFGLLGTFRLPCGVGLRTHVIVCEIIFLNEKVIKPRDLEWETKSCSESSIHVLSQCFKR